MMARSSGVDSVVGTSSGLEVWKRSGCAASDILVADS